MTTDTEPVSEVRWGNDDKGSLYIAPLSFLAFVLGVSVCLWGFIVVLQENADNLIKKYFLLLMFPAFAIFGGWFARGSFLVVKEFLTKFIVHTGWVEGDAVKLNGFYFRRARFRLGDILAIEPLEFDEFRWSNLTEDATNYVVKLKDGRVFYLSGWLDDADGFAAALGYSASASA